MSSATSTTATKWRELNEDEKPARGMEIRIPGDKQPLGVVVKVGPGEIKYRPHGGGALQVISANAEVEVRATAEESIENEKPKPKKQEEAETPAKPKTKKSKAASAKPEPEPKQLEIVEEPQDETNGEQEEEEDDNENEDKNGSEDDGDDNEKEEPNVKATATGWMRIEELVEKSGVPLGRILKARREGSFEGMTKPDPDYDGVGRKPLIYSPAALKVATSLTGSGGKGGRPPGKKNVAATATATPTKAKSSRHESESRVSAPPKRHINVERSTTTKATAPAQSHLYAAGESLQSTLEGIDAEIARLNELKTRLEEAWSFFAV